jgi:hypothetical protein
MAMSPSRLQPKLSASQLADYLVAPTPIGQMGILRQAKAPGQHKPLIIQYQYVRRYISACLQSPSTLNRVVAEAIHFLEQRRDDTSNGPLVRDDAERSLEVIQTFQRTRNALDIGMARFDAALNPSPSLMISGVEVTVWPDAIAHVVTRNGTDRIGQVFIRCTIGGAGDIAENRRAEANGHLATIAHMHTAAFLSHLGIPHAPTSMVIDVSRENVIKGPVNATRRVANIQAACGMIAAVWPTVSKFQTETLPDGV